MKKYVYTLMAGLPLLLSACLKDEGVFKENGSQGIVELTLAARNTSTPYAVKSIAIEKEAAATLPVTVNYTGESGAPEEVRVTLAVVDSIVGALYPDNSVAPLPAEYYELPPSNVVTIPKGGKTATYAIKVNSSLFPAKSYAMGVKIVSASAGVVSGNYSTGVYLLLVRSGWEGTYKVDYQWHETGSFDIPHEPFSDTVTLATVGPETLEVTGFGGKFAGYTRYTFVSEREVKVAAFSGADLRVSVKSCRADVADFSIFTVRYTIYLTDGDLELEETYTRISD
jgi:hypothetical protein